MNKTINITTISPIIWRRSTCTKSHCPFSPLFSQTSLHDLALFQFGYSQSTHHKRDSQITRSKISYSLIERQPVPCTTTCGNKFHALAVHPHPTITPHSGFLVLQGFARVPLGSWGPSSPVFCRILLGSY